MVEKIVSKNLCTSLRKHAKDIIDFEIKKIFPLTKEELKSHQDGSLYLGKKILKKTL